MQNRKLIGLIVAVVLALVVYGSYLQTTRSGKVAVDISVVAQNPTLIINGKNSPTGTLYLKPGGYEITASAAGFQSAKKIVTVQKEAVKTTFLLTPESEAAKTWAIQHNQDYLAAEKRAGQQTQQEGEALTKTNPIIQYLPQKTSYYAINYRLDEKQQAILQISADTALGRQVALEKVRSLGFDPTDYRVEFTGLVNPFQTGGIR